MPRLMRLAKLALATVVALVAVWVEAVLRTPDVKRRKALRRSRRPRPNP